ncbi:MAG: DUF3800 domain-containing protein [Thermodesulfovibrionales bacterium]
MRPAYRLYIDESGDHTYGRPEKSSIYIRHGEEKHLLGDINTYPRLDQVDKRYLCLTGCIFNLSYYREQFVPTMDAFKRDFFDPDEQVILHAKEIIQRQGPFHLLRNPELSQRFDAGIIDLIANAEYTVINVVIDKKNHIENFGVVAWHPYHYCLANLLARYGFFLQSRRAHGDVLAESRGKTEDFELKEVYSSLYEKGTRFKSAKFFQQFLTSREIKIKPKTKNIAGLQLADILAHPLKKYTLIQKGLLNEPDEAVYWLRVVDAAKGKLDRREKDGKVEGYGLVFI